MSGPSRVGIIGLGLIGGGIALDLTRAGRDVRGYDLDPEVRRRAGELGIATTDQVDELVAAVEMVVVAVPMARTGAVVTEVAASAPDVIITDVGSVKDPAALGIGTAAGRYVGGHPMGGSERSGIDAARPGLFDGVAWFLTPTADTRVGDLVATLRLVQLTAADPIIVTAEAHDRYVAMISHVPHVVAYALNASATEVVGDGLHGLGGGSFRDTTRVASSDPDFWADVLRANGAGVSEALALVRQWLDRFEASLSDRDGLAGRLTAARRRPVPGPDVPEVEVVLPPLEEPVGVAASRLYELGGRGFAVTGITVGPQAVTLELRWR